MASIASIPKGTRDFSSEVIHKREYIFNTIKNIFKLYGYQPIETPAMENLSTLLGKYGLEGDRLVFRILNSGDFIDNYQSKDLKKLEEVWQQLLSKLSKEHFSFDFYSSIINSYYTKNDRISGIIYDYLNSSKLEVLAHCQRNNIDDGPTFIKYLRQYRYPHLVNKLKGFILTKAELSKGITEKGLRYDLTVPFARYVVQHQNELIFPFKRYQIQPVWRGDNPQKGRYREFYQCDIDVIGSNSLLNEFELISIVDEVFTKLQIEIIIKINNRKVLTGIAEYIGEPDKILDITIAIDKLDKVDLEAVNLELKNKGISTSSLLKLQPILTLHGTTQSKLLALDGILSNSDIGTKGLMELKNLFRLLESKSLNAKVELDLTLARGLDYYTGAIIEVKSQAINIGSICGGGRYDNLTGIFGLKGTSGVGISFGADRIYDVLNQLDMLNEIKDFRTTFMILNLDKENLALNLKILEKLHKSAISCELYPDQAEKGKQMTYADTKKIPYIIIAGEDKTNKDSITIRNISSREQTVVSFTDLDSFLKNEMKMD